MTTRTSLRSRPARRRGGRWQGALLLLVGTIAGCGAGTPVPLRAADGSPAVIGTGGALTAGTPGGKTTAELKGRADRGDAAAQLALGLRALGGEHGPAADPDTAEKYLRLAAFQGSSEAQYQLGRYFVAGRGGEIDGPQAAIWLQKAAGQRHPAAMSDLAVLLFDGALVPPDRITALTLLRQAADLGEPRARTLLPKARALVERARSAPGALLPLLGDELATPADDPAMQTGADADAAAVAALAREAGGDPTLAEPTNAPGLARDPTTIDRAEPGARTAAPPSLGILPPGSTGRVITRVTRTIVHPDGRREVVTTETVREDGEPPAPMAEPARRTTGGSGTGSPRADAHLGSELSPRERGVLLLEEAADAGDGAAQYVYALLHRDGRGVPRDPREAVRWLERTVNDREPAVQFALANLLERGEGVAPDPDRAYRLFLDAARQGYPPALVAVGHCHERGRGVRADPVEAAAWYELAAARQAPPYVGPGRVYQNRRGQVLAGLGWVHSRQVPGRVRELAKMVATYEPEEHVLALPPDLPPELHPQD